MDGDTQLFVIRPFTLRHGVVPCICFFRIQAPRIAMYRVYGVPDRPDQPDSSSSAPCLP